MTGAGWPIDGRDRRVKDYQAGTYMLEASRYDAMRVSLGVRK
jgi:hypothetical protein